MNFLRIDYSNLEKYIVFPVYLLGVHVYLHFALFCVGKWYDSDQMSQIPNRETPITGFADTLILLPCRYTWSPGLQIRLRFISLSFPPGKGKPTHGPLGWRSKAPFRVFSWGFLLTHSLPQVSYFIEQFLKEGVGMLASSFYHVWEQLTVTLVCTTICVVCGYVKLAFL